jgi:hypothetical protein
MYYTRRMNGLGALGQSTCEEMTALAATFQRLSQKKDKSAATRASAATQAEDWRRRAAACLAARSAPAVTPAPLPPPVTVTPSVAPPVVPYQYPYAYQPAPVMPLQPTFSPLPSAGGGGFEIIPAGGYGYETIPSAAPGYETIPESGYGYEALPASVRPGASFPPQAGGGFDVVPDMAVNMYPQPMVAGGTPSPQAGPCSVEQMSLPSFDDWGPIDVIQVVCAQQTPGAIQAGPFAVQESGGIEVEEIQASGMFGLGRFLG